MTPDDERDNAAIAASWAAARWPLLTKNEQSMIRFGLFPHAVMTAGEQLTGCTGRELAIAMMDQAKANGGMRA